MKRHSDLFWIGLIAYTCSFFLVAAGPFDLSKPLRGYFCALATLRFSWEQAKLGFHGVLSIDKPLDYISYILSGWINPVFLIALLASSFRALQGLFTTARVILILMIPSCWIVFYYHQLYPREGHLLWIAGMLMALFSKSEETAK